EETISGEVNAFDLSSDGSTLIYLSGDRLRVLRAGDKPGDNRNTPSRKTGWLDMTRIKLAVNPAAEWRQMFREAWRLQRDQFWTPDMSKVDWEAVYKRYRPLVERVASRDEFSDLIWEMQGELGTSHAYESGGDYRPGPYYSQGFLGADYAFDHEQNAWRITHIYRGDAWDPNHDSPLQGPGINVQVGDYLLAVNGRTLDATFSPAAALVFQAREEVSLTLRSQPAGSGEREGNQEEPVERTVTVRALGSENNVRYRAWVRANRKQVHAASDGRVGYIHIPDMGLSGYAEFHRGYLAEVDRPALIIDVRFNRGGNVSGLLLEKLARRRLGYTVSRWGQLPIPYPDESPAGPMVALTNEFAASDGDIFSHGFKLLNLGPLIGKRTWGGVIGISPRHTLVDGTLTTQPEYSTWFYDVGWGVENYGVDPDIEVDITPQDYVQGKDAQLERAIAEALDRLETNPPREPDFSARPSRAVPRLPHRE
ncbi:MAG TPA: S41 family peptidase, partial [Anaerolineales bacterium]|nr:S41 family peptidase [Anaerolineales bacterium]